jgi:cellulose synthase/poly-beta-1,6-N-acetylglucosamine synthase-like glycosyltransferase
MRLAGRRRLLAGARQGRVLVLIPAKDEERTIEATLRSVENQSRRPDEMIVIADDCRDGTEAIVRSRSDWTLWRSEANRHKKAGALNQAIDRLERGGLLEAGDFLLIMDADTELDDAFIENALACHEQLSRVGGICATFYGKKGGGLLGALQRIEYARFARSLARKRGITFVLSGTATMYRADVLLQLRDQRGFVYDTTSMLEDYEISLALRHRGYRCFAPRDCRVRTDVMPTVSRLWRQRIRWQRGTLEELRRYGVTRVTLPDIGRQLLLCGAMLTRLLLVTLISVTVALRHGFEVRWEWTALSAVIAVERALTVWKLGWTYALTALILVPEELYGVFREAFFVRSAWLAFRRADWAWHST